MGEPAKRRASYDDLLAVPDRFTAELLNGEVVASPRPAVRHTLAASALGAEITGPFQRGKGGPGGWVILDEPELHLHADVLVPDLAAWRRERMPVVPDAPAIELAPDWVCEVLALHGSNGSRRENADLRAGECRARVVDRSECPHARGLPTRWRWLALARNVPWRSARARGAVRRD